MSCSYAEGLSPYENKGKLGLPETVDKPIEFDKKVKKLAEWIEEAKHVVIHTGAGISTAAGIPDFRGPNGVWTLEKKGIKPQINISFDDAKPTPTHMAILELVKQKKVHYVVSQNIDALHLRSGLSRKHLAELHGNMYVDQCNKCERQFVRKSANTSVGQKNLNISCPYKGFRPCRGTLHDTILDWEHNLPQRDINLGDYNSSIADLSICLGTTLQINPSGMLPTYTKKYNQGKLVICNLSNTKHDKKADLVIRGYVDSILEALMKRLNLTIPEYDEKLDPSRSQEKPYQVEWTLLPSDVQRVKKKFEQKMREKKKGKMKKEENAKEEIELEMENKHETSERTKEEIEDVPIKKRRLKNQRDANYTEVELLDIQDVNKEVEILDVKVLPKKRREDADKEDSNRRSSPLETRERNGENTESPSKDEKRGCSENGIKLNEESEGDSETEVKNDNGKCMNVNKSEIKETLVKEEMKSETRIIDVKEMASDIKVEQESIGKPSLEVKDSCH